MRDNYVEYIEDGELLYRAIPNKPSHWKKELNRPSTALFKDPNGVSVDRDGNRAEASVVSFLWSRLPGFGVCRLNAGHCRTVPTHPIPKPEKNNIHHGEIHDGPDKVLITASSKLRTLVNSAILVQEPDV
jgi:hypothetical protein